MAHLTASACSVYDSIEADIEQSSNVAFYYYYGEARRS